jgi:predicted  nucleic acid-binding Zn-ribbon protein
MSRPFKLYRLQQIDSQIDWHHTRIKEIDAALENNQALRQAQESAGQAEQAHQQARKALQQAEEAVRSQKVKIEQNESTLYGGKVKIPKELQDLQNEVAALKRYLGVLEERQLETMFAEEEAAGVNDRAAAELAQAQAGFEKLTGELNDERARLVKETARFQEERLAATGAIEPGDMGLYENLRRQRRGIAVARVNNKACAACGSTLSTALLHAAHSPSQLTRCETCGRILYVG